MPSDAEQILIQTADLQRDYARCLKLAVSVIKGPDPQLRLEASDILMSLADTLEDSSARLLESVST